VRTIPPLGLMIQPQLFNFSAEGVAVNPQSLGGLGSISVILIKHVLDETLLEFRHGVGKLNSVFNHANDESF
jgi:hypothetical protein